MIELTKLTNEKYYLNPELIEIIEVNPDTLITMTNGKTHYALESAEEVIARIEAYKVKLIRRSKSQKRVDKPEE
jgi:flagellar protein FlbD